MQNGGKLLPFSSTFPLQASLNHLFSYGNPTLMTNRLPHSWHRCISCSHKTPFHFLPKCGISQTTLVFPTCFSNMSNLGSKITSIPLHNWTHNALHIVNISKITFEHFYPWKLCSANVFTLVRDIIVFLDFFNNDLSFLFAKTWISNKLGASRGNEGR
jgi:hypothetical protein